jgi:Family of unknown function (DUF6370)
MKKLFTLILCIVFVSATKAQSIAIPDSTKKIIKAEASCGQCQFGIKAKGCNLAVRIDGKAYFVDGTSLDDHGDAHAADGFCETIRKAEMQGAVVDNRFKATYFKVLPLKKEEPAKMQ